MTVQDVKTWVFQHDNPRIGVYNSLFEKHSIDGSCLIMMQVSSTRATWPSILTDSPYQRHELGPPYAICVTQPEQLRDVVGDSAPLGHLLDLQLAIDLLAKYGWRKKNDLWQKREDGGLNMRVIALGLCGPL